MCVAILMHVGVVIILVVGLEDVFVVRVNAPSHASGLRLVLEWRRLDILGVLDVLLELCGQLGSHLLVVSSIIKVRVAVERHVRVERLRNLDDPRGDQLELLVRGVVRPHASALDDDGAL